MDMPEPIGIDFTSYIAERTRNFSGRQWVFELIQEWLAAGPESPRFFLLQGEPGSGKTAIAGRLSAHSTGNLPANSSFPSPSFLSAIHFCAATDNHWISPRAFSQSIAAQLAERYPVFANALLETGSDRPIHLEANVRAETNQGEIVGIRIHQLNLTAGSDMDAFDRLVRTPLEVLCREQPSAQIVLLIDALDETLSYYGADSIISLVAGTQQLPRNVRFLLTSRPDDRIENRLRDVRSLLLSAEQFDTLNETDIRDYIQHRLETEEPLTAQALGLPPISQKPMIDSLVDHAQGNFQYVRFILDEVVEGHRNLGDFDGLPAGLDGLYEASLRRVVEQGKGRWDKDYSPIMAILSVAQTSLTRPQMEAFTGHSEEQIWQLLGELKQYIELDEGIDKASAERYRLYHLSVRDFLGKTLLSVEGRTLRNAFYLPQRSGHDQISAAYQDRTQVVPSYAPNRLDDYGFRYLSYHLAEGGQEALNNLGRLITPTFLQAKIARGGGERPVLDDLRIALTAAERSGDPVRALAWGWVYVGFRDRIATQLSAETIPLFVYCGLTDLVRDGIEALDAEEVRQAEHEWAVALAEVGDVEAAIAAAGKMDSFGRQKALEEIALRVALRERAGAVRLIREQAIQPGRSLHLDDILASAPLPRLCGILAQEETFVEQALHLAGENQQALEAVAVAVAPRDPLQALHILDRLSTIRVYQAGFKVYYTAASAKETLVFLLADTHPETVLVLKKHVGEFTTSRGEIAVVRALAHRDAQQALDYLSNSRALDHAPLAFALALASIAFATRDTEIRNRIEIAWETRETFTKFTIGMVAPREGEIDVLARSDIRRLCDDPLARNIVQKELMLLQRVAFEKPSHSSGFDSPGNGIGQVAAAMSLFDVEAAVTFARDTVERHYKNHGNSFAEAMLHIVRAVAQTNLPTTLFVLDYCKDLGYYSHLAHVEAVRQFGNRRFEDALKIIESVDVRYTTTRAILIGVLAKCVGPGQKDHLHTLLKRLPRYIDSERFTDLYNAARTTVFSIPQSGKDASREHTNLYKAEPWLESRTATKDFWLEQVIMSYLKEVDFETIMAEYAETWSLAQTDPEAALKRLSGVIGVENAWPTIVAGVSLVDPERALLLFQRYRSESSSRLNDNGLASLLGHLAGILAQNSSKQAMSFLAEFQQEPNDSSLKHELDSLDSYNLNLAVAEVVRVVSKRDWREALTLAEQIERPDAKCLALKYIAAETTCDNSSTNVAAIYTALIKAVGAVSTDHHEQTGAFRILIQSMLIERRPVRSALAPLAVGVALATRETFFRSLRDLFQLVLRECPEAMPQFQAEIERVRTLLAA